MNLKELAEYEAMSKYLCDPLPAQTTLWYGYEFNEAGKVEVSMFNILGQKISTQNHVFCNR